MLVCIYIVVVSVRRMLFQKKRFKFFFRFFLSDVIMCVDSLATFFVCTLGFVIEGTATSQSMFYFMSVHSKVTPDSKKHIYYLYILAYPQDYERSI